MKPFNFALSLVLLSPLSSAFAGVHYVDANSTNPLAPYTNWSTAAVAIQDALNVAARNDLVLVTNGLYDTGGLSLDHVLTNRVIVPPFVTLQSVNGPSFTAIVGYQLPGAVNGIGAVRCAYLKTWAVLSGFTVTNGATLVSGNEYTQLSGGGIYCGDTSPVITNCVICGNSAYWWGGGLYKGYLTKSEVRGNSAAFGGGIYGGTADTSRLVGNFAHGSGGGACDTMLVSCEVTSNSADSGGGVAFQMGDGDINSCTITANSARFGGGIVATPRSYINNCIIYYNQACPPSQNYASGGLFAGCCSTPLPSGGGPNFSIDPQLASSSHLSVSSPCRGAGTRAFFEDIDGDPWLTFPSVGCDEFIPGSVTGALTVAIRAPFTNAALGSRLNFSALINGRTSASAWDFGDGIILSNHPYADHAWNSAGNYIVSLTAFNETFPQGLRATLNVQVLPPATLYVALGNSNAVPPYNSWVTAAPDIQSAIDLAIPGALVLVGDGVYDLGGRAVSDTMTNRVVVDKPITLASLNGPSSTFIIGAQAPGGGCGDSAVRCVYLADGSTLSGFTLTNGATRTAGDLESQAKGGAAWCPSVSPVLTNCVLSGNRSFQRAGGAYGGTLRNCIVANNASTDGGGVFSSALYQCLLVGNTAVSGVACFSLLQNCDLVANSAGSYRDTLDNCIVYFNTNYNFNGSLLNYCCSLPLASGPGNFTNDPAFLDLALQNFRLQPQSPCINSGNNSFADDPWDLDGKPRIQGGTVDTGAYEFQSPQSLISYAWLQFFGLPTNGSADFQDPDHDGMNNWTEFLAGTDPTNAASVLALLPPAITSSGVLLTWQSVPNRSYALEKATDLLARPCFSCVASNLPGATGITSFTDTNSTTTTLYRLRLQR